MKTYLTHARLVLADDLVEDAALLIEDGHIAAINPEPVRAERCLDLGGKTLMPGMIDLHCDALEKEVEPRPNVHFPLDFACAQADKRNAAAGITTVYHALSFANDELGVRNNAFAARIARAVHDWHPHGLIDNRVHCRYEITDEDAVEVLTQLVNEGTAHLISFMDHTPGQGQFKDIIAYRNYLNRTYKKSDEEIEAILERKYASAGGAHARMQALAGAAFESGIRLASHDDDTPQRVQALHDIGARISEFPVSMEAAQAAKAAGMSTIFGAPNILRGKSQSGSMRAIEAIEAGVADCLCADYAPATLIVSVLHLPERCALDLPGAVRLVTLNPARAAGLHDRGEIAVGKRADLVAYDTPGGLAQVTDVWSRGVAVYRARYDHG